MLRFLTAGESHGPCLTAVIEGCPAGFALDLATANEDMRRRMLGYGRGGRMKIEQDTIEIRSGFASAKRWGRRSRSWWRIAIGRTGKRRCPPFRRTGIRH